MKHSIAYTGAGMWVTGTCLLTGLYGIAAGVLGLVIGIGVLLLLISMEHGNEMEVGT